MASSYSLYIQLEANKWCVWHVIKMFWVVVAFVLLFHINGSWCCPGHERESLFHFKASVVDPPQILNSWHVLNYCECEGIQCHPHTTHVIHLDLYSSKDANYNYGDFPHLKRPLSNLARDFLSLLLNLE